MPHLPLIQAGGFTTARYIINKTKGACLLVILVYLFPSVQPGVMDVPFGPEKRPGAGAPSASGPALVNGIPNPDVQQVQAHVDRREYFIQYQQAAGSLQSPNRKHNMRLTYQPDGFEAVPRKDSSRQWQIAFRLKGIYRGQQQVFAADARAQARIAENRLVYDHTGFQVEYLNSQEGMRQNFVVAKKPAGAAPLAVKMELSYNDMQLICRHNELTGQQGGTTVYTYKDLKVWDAKRRPLTAEMALEGNTLALVVDDRTATYPVTIDPLSTTPAATLECNQADAAMGLSVASAGDVNNDGYDDVIVGAPLYDNGQIDEGAAFVYHGSASGIGTTPAATLERNQADAKMGYAVASAGDVNNDGYDDIIVGAYQYDNGQADEGVAFVYLGSSGGIGTTPAVTLERNQAGSNLGISVASAGDVNNDGYGDVIAGANLYDNGQTDEGAAFVYLGSSGGLSNTPVATLECNEANAHFGRSVASAGDVNNDGYGDVLAGANDYGFFNKGAAFVYQGHAGGVTTTAAATLQSSQDFAQTGFSVASAGDVNNDGYDDVIVGAYAYNWLPLDGIAYVYHGSAGGVITTAAATLTSGQTGAAMGYSVASAGDVNNDGYSDVVVGAYQYDNGQSNEGAALVYQGSAGGINTVPLAILDGNQVDAVMGVSVASAGDVNGDGYDDLIVGASWYDNGQSNEGAAFVYHGGSSGGCVPPTTANAGSNAAVCGQSTSLAGNTPGVGTGAWTLVSGPGTASFGAATSPTSSVNVSTTGIYTFRWTISNAPCTPSTDDVSVTFNPYPTLSCPANTTVDDNDPAFALSGATPTGGTYSGTGVSSGMFNPALAGIGTHTITYTYSSAGCASSCTFAITVDAACPAAGTVWYVDGAAAPGGSGTSWACAFQQVQDAINAASSGQEVWVKAGTYKPTKDFYGNAAPANPRTKTFYLKNGVAVYGGFAGTETLRSQRNWTNNPTILSGDLGNINDYNDNCYHVVSSINDSRSTVLDGFTVEKGIADIISNDDPIEGFSTSRHTGGGLYNLVSSLSVANCIFSGNYALFGGGMYNGAGAPLVTNCIFTNNSAIVYNGGGMCNSGASSIINGCVFVNNSANPGQGAGMSNISSSTPTITNCIFSNNTASEGGAMLNKDSAVPGISNCLFSGNSATNQGGGVYNVTSGQAMLTNCTFSGNKATNDGGGLYNSSSSPALKNCLIWNNRAGTTTGSASAGMLNSAATPVITYSLIQNHNPAGAGNLNGITYAADANYPGFVTPLDPATAPSAAGNFQLTVCSPAVNKGTNTGAPATDLYGNARPFGASADLGVHEYQSAPTPAVAVCQNTTVQLDGAGNGTLNASALNNGSTGCTPLNFSASQTNFTCSNLGLNTITLTVTGYNGVTATCNATVTVADNTAPTAICQNTTVNLDQSGNATLAATQVDGGSTDNCGIASRSVVPNAFTTANVGPNTVTLTVTDHSNRTASCTATVTVTNTNLPAAVCRPYTVALGSGGTAAITPANVDGGSSAVGGIQSMNVSPNTFNCNNLGNNTVTLTVTANNGQSATCNAVVTVQDNTAPMAACQNISVNLSGNSASISAAQVLNTGTSSDNCGTVNAQSVSPSTFTCVNIGPNTVTLTVNDGHSNTTTCTATVTVNDNTPPTAICQNVTVNLSGSSAGVTAAQVNNGSTDNCGTINLIGVTPSTFTCANIGPNAVTLTVNDGRGNSSTCTATVTVNDNTPPTAICQNVTVNLSGNSASVTAAQVNNGSSDNCGTVNLVGVVPSTFTCANIGPNTVTLTVNDSRGNSSTCSATVTVNDNTPPTAICQNVTVNLSGNSAGVTAAQVNNGSSDNCGAVNLVGVTPSTFTCANIGPNAVTLTVNDGRGNSSTCSATVTVNDNTPPTAICQNVTVNLSGNSASVTAAQVNNGSTGNCSTVNLVDVTPSTFTCANIGPNTVTLTVNDGRGNSSTCAATVTVVDNTPPTAICQNVTVNLSGSSAGVTAAQVNNGSTDNCGTINLVGVAPSTFTCANIGPNTVTLTVNDGRGNSSTCAATVTVVDNTPPTAICQNTTVNLSGSSAGITAAQVNNGSSDNCGTVNLVGVAPSTFTCANIGPNTVVLTVNDGHGNSSACSATVTVVDNTPPTVSCPANQTVAPTSTVPCVAVATGIDATYNDLCTTPALAYALSGATTGSGSGQASGQVFQSGSTIVTYTATDGAGNTAACAFTVTVNPCQVTFNGVITWKQDNVSGVKDATVTITGDRTGSTTTAANGAYSLTLDPGSNFTITPNKTQNLLNGINVSDVQRIQQHLSGNPITNPWQLIAADVNGNNQVSSLDANIVQLALLGNPSAMSQFISSWRFVPKSHVPNNPPWGFPENIALSGAAGTINNLDFWGIKVGDVAATYANPANSSAEPLVLRTPDQMLETGRELTVLISGSALRSLSALQFSLRFDPEYLQLLEVQPLGGLPLRSEHFGLWQVESGSVRCAWSDAQAGSLQAGVQLFLLRFIAREGGVSLREVLQLDDATLPGMVFNGDGQPAAVQLRFDGLTAAPTVQDNGILTLQNYPNPFSSRTTVRFELAEACQATLRVADATGRVVAQRQQHYVGGVNEVTFTLDTAPGVLYCELITPRGVLTRKMILTTD